MAAPARLLDLDGTLVLTRPLYARCLAGANDERICEFADALAMGGNIVRLMAGAGVGRGAFKRRLAALDVQLAPGWAEVLPALQDRGHPLGIVTSIPGWLAAPILAAAGIADLMDVVVHAGVCRVPKPSAKPIMAAYDLLGLAPATEDVYVGDHAVDAMAAAAAGIRFAWASWGYGEEPPGARRLAAPADILEAQGP